MKVINRSIIAILFVSFWVGCADVEFKQGKSSTCEAQGCVVTPDGFNQYSGSTKAGQVDILFVDDNSGSMYTEQTKMGDRFPNFLTSIAQLNYRIGIITTDVSASPNNTTPREANGFGAYQDGRLLLFPNGQKVMTNDTGDKVNQFRQTIQRPETLECDSSGYSDCPSGDERGIYALNLMFDNPDLDFFRPEAHLAVVILSDENERSNGGYISGYELEDYDLPETLVSRLGTSLGISKMMSVHSVIIKSNDTTCYNTQNSQGNGVKGHFGFLYEELSNPSSSLKALGNIVDGETGSICASDYGAQLGDIGSKITNNVNLIPLVCDPAIINGQTSLEVTLTPVPPYQVFFDVNAQNQLVLDPPPPPQTEVSYTYKCPRSI